MLTIHCQCGEVFHAEERHIGGAIKCRSCGQVLGIGATPPTPPATSMASGRWPVRRWGMVAVALIVVATAGAVLLFPREQRQQQPVSPSISQPPAEIVSRPAPEPLPSPLAHQPTPRPRSVPDPESLKAKLPVTRLKSGTNIWTPLGAYGRGTLRINNGTTYDAAVTLLDEETGTARRHVYIRAGEVTTFSAIAPCQCRLLFALGTDWNVPAEEFGEDSSFSVFDDLLRFNESKTENRVQVATFSVTLHPVPEGNAKATRLSKEEFERLLGKHQSRKGREFNS